MNLTASAAALKRAGVLDLSRPEGPTGFIDEGKPDTIRYCQHDNRLKVDGLIRPGGKTIRMLEAKIGAGTPRKTLILILHVRSCRLKMRMVIRWGLMRQSNLPAWPLRFCR